MEKVVTYRELGNFTRCYHFFHADNTFFTRDPTIWCRICSRISFFRKCSCDCSIYIISMKLLVTTIVIRKFHNRMYGCYSEINLLQPICSTYDFILEYIATLKSPFSFSGKVQKSWSRYGSIYCNDKNQEIISQPPPIPRTNQFQRIETLRAYT